MSLNSLIILSGMSFDFETFLRYNRLIAVDICYLSTFLKVKVEFNSVHLFLIASILGWSLYPIIRGKLSGLRQFLAAESPLKMTKNAFYFTSKAFFILKICKFLPWVFGHVAKRLDKKDQVLISNFMTSQCG